MWTSCNLITLLLCRVWTREVTAALGWNPHWPPPLRQLRRRQPTEAHPAHSSPPSTVMSYLLPLLVPLRLLPPQPIPQPPQWCEERDSTHPELTLTGSQELTQKVRSHINIRNNLIFNIAFQLFLLIYIMDIAHSKLFVHLIITIV